MTSTLTLTAGHRPDGAPSLTAVGEIDMSNAETFATVLADAVHRSEKKPLVVDLTAVEYLDSAGLAALFEHAEHIELLSSPLLEPLLTVSGLADLVTIHSQ
ncbi:STAS domain-containing protein [Actinoplanes regularis]|uniref:Anti-anti-sigma factor n=1 Tax=Actinoplanes regularis TaxID=52697 RepID=A0A239JI00_9ACTN|nr:STAS domain-containing protein [Actinoplanes regularis]GIE92034.1 anti-anti-sigma factor [Actinoplanes regularis]SNT05457.1 anti-anti-sigma factor [Actinoplanes regularis]